MTRLDLSKQWEDRLAAFKDSGQSAPKWCASQGFNIHQFRYWKKKLSNSPVNTTSRWLPVEIDNYGSDESNSTLRIKIKQATIEISPGFDPTLLKSVVRTLTEL
jgi:hypothetical protein